MGRNGMHKYNTRDRAMLSVRSILEGRLVYDVRRVNQDAEYHEAGTASSASVSGLRLISARASATDAGAAETRP